MHSPPPRTYGGGDTADLIKTWSKLPKTQGPFFLTSVALGSTTSHSLQAHVSLDYLNRVVVSETVCLLYSKRVTALIHLRFYIWAL